MYLPTPFKKQPRAGCLKQGAAIVTASSEPILKEGITYSDSCEPETLGKDPLARWH